MLLSNAWKNRRQLLGNRSRRAASASRRPQNAAIRPAAESLEVRTMLTTSSLFADGELSIIIDEGNDSVAVRTDPMNPAFVQVLVNGNLDRSLPPILANSVARITIVGSDTDNLIDLSTVVRADFSYIDPVTGASMEIDVDAGNGHDTILASVDFDDTLDGGHGRDVIDASMSSGNMSVFGGDGNDTITTGLGADTIDAGDGSDLVSAGDGNDFVNADDGADTVDGGAGDDTLEGGTGADSLEGGDGDDLIHGRDGTDALFGDAGNDRIFGGAQNDLIRGGDGADSINGNSGADFIDGDNGDDLINGDNGHDTIYGNGGNDTLSGDDGNDSLEADSGNDLVVGGAGDDTANGAAGDDTVRGNSGSDSLCGGAGVDSVDGGAGGDLISGFCEFPRSVSIDDVSVDEALASPTTTVTFTITLSAPFDHEVVVDYTTFEAGATSTAADPLNPLPGEIDFVATSGRITFLPGVTSLTVTVDVVGDALVESDENFFVVLETAERAEIADGYGEALIIDDEVTPLPIVDLGLLLDDSASFAALGPALAAAFPQIVASIQQQLPGFDVGFGVSRFVDYAGAVSQLNRLPFTLNQPIISTSETGFAGAIDAALLRDVDANGANNPQESFLEGLWQVATGMGLDGDGDGDMDGNNPLNWFAGSIVVQTAPGNTGDVPAISTFMSDPGNQILLPTEAATTPINAITTGLAYRTPDLLNGQSTVRLVFVATDNNTVFRDDGVDPVTGVYTGVNGTEMASVVRQGGDPSGPANGATIQATIDALINEGIRVVGIATPADTNAGAAPRGPLEAFSRLTGGINEASVPIARTLAGVSAPIAPGEALYFVADPANSQQLANAIVDATVASVGPAEASINQVFVVEGDGAQQQVDIEVRLDRAPVLTAATVDFVVESDTAVSGQDFVATSGTLTFQPATQTSSGDVSQIVTVTILGDDVLENLESFRIRLLNPSPGVAFATGVEFVQSVSVIDDDSPAESGDFLFGGGSRDTIVGTEGSDLIVGEAGNDILFGQDGDDTIYGGGGNDTLFGEGGDDSLIGNSGSDVPVGGDGDDTVLWRGNKDGNDTFTAEAGFDRILVEGSSGNDAFSVGQSGSTLVISGTTRAITLTGDILGFASGAEQVVINGNGGDDTITVNDINDVGFFVLSINGGAGADTIAAAGALVGNVPVVLNGDSGNDTIVGSSGIDSIFGGDGNDEISGGAGNDLINGNDGDDLLSGDGGDDTVFGDLGVDLLLGGAGNDLLDGGFGNDSLDGEDGDDSLFGSFGDDLLIGSGGDDQLNGQVDNDTLFGGAGNDTLDGGRSDDTINGNSGDDKIRGDHGNDYIGGDAGNDTIDGGDGDDTILGEDGADGLSGGDGDDMIIGGLMRDTISGGDGNDQLLGGSGNDVIVGGDGDDTLSGNSGADTMGGNLGADTYLSGVPGIVDPLDLIDDNFVLSASMLAKLDASN
jgi:Ca2+-binding RTX toxin-like protein